MSGRGRSRRGSRAGVSASGVIRGPGYIVPPADLGPEALEMWGELAPEVARLGLIHGEGAGLLAEYCRLSVESDGICALMRREGDGIESPRRMKRVKELLRLDSRLLRLARRLGLTPMARARLGLQ